MTALILQTEPLNETLPTMYDLPSEDPEEPGLPDTFHFYQPSLLTETFITSKWSADQIYLAADVNLYYDVHHLNWYKRPDWYAVVGVPRLYQGRDLRLSYVIWQERISPFLVVELLSPGTEKEDLGKNPIHTTENPPTKWEVYEQILQIPYYVAYNRYTQELHAFVLKNRRYHRITEQRLWLNEINLGIGIWKGIYRGIESHWLRFYDDSGNWIATSEEQARYEAQCARDERLRAKQEAQRAEDAMRRAEQEHQRAEKLAAKLRELGIHPD